MGLFDDVFKPVKEFAGGVGEFVNDPFDPANLASAFGTIGFGSIGGPIGGLIGGGVAKDLAKSIFEKPPEEFSSPGLDRSGLAEDEKQRLESIQKKIQEDIVKEDELRQNLSDTRVNREQLLNKILGQTLGEISTIADVERAAAGEIGAKKGLTRSTFTKNQVDEASLREAQSRQQAQSDIAEEVERGREAERKTIQSLEDRRQRLKTQAELEDLASLQRELQFLDETNVRRAFEAELAQSALDQRQKNMMIDTMGGLVGVGATIYTAGLL